MLIDDALIIRASTVKANIRYQVHQVAPSEQVVDAVEWRVGQLGSRMTGDEKGVVYCRSHAEAETIAARVGCDFYHAGIVDAQRRQQVLTCWIDGEEGGRWIAATTGLGTGIDIAGITAVIHMGPPYGLVDFVQQTGRGGRRDGEVVESVIIKTAGRGYIRPEASDVEHWNHEAMITFMEQESCGRVTLGQIMDGEGRDCDQLQAELCDRCCDRRGDITHEEEDDDEEDEGYQSQRVIGSQRLKMQVQSTQQALGRLRAWFREVQECCPTCWVKWHRRAG